MGRLIEIIDPNSLKIEPRLSEVSMNLEPVMDMRNDTMFLSGSVVEKYGNDRSDIDTYIIGEYEYKKYGKLAWQHPTKDYYIEVHFLPNHWLSKIENHFNNFAYDDYEGINNIDTEELEFYYLVSIGIPLINNKNFNKLCKCFKKDRANQLWTAYHGLACTSLLAQMETQLNNGNSVYAFFLARRALERAIDSYTASKGQGYIGWKYRFAKLSRVIPVSSDIYQILWNLKSLGTMDYVAYSEKVAECIHLLGIDKFPCLLTSSNFFKQVSDVKLLNVLGKFLIKNHEKIYEISEEAYFIWEHLDGKHSIDLIEKKFDDRFELSDFERKKIFENCIENFQSYRLIEMVEKE